MSSGDLLPPEPETPTEKPAKRGRPTGSTTKPKRRNFAVELAELQGKVNQAAFLLKQAVQPDATPEVAKAFMAAAVQTLNAD